MNLEHDPSETVDPAVAVSYLHDELDPGDRASFAAHLEQCISCRSLLDELDSRTRKTRTALELADFELPDEHEQQRLLQAVRSGVRSRARAKRFRIAAGWTLALLAGSAVASPPIRAWIAERWTGVVTSSPSSTSASHENGTSHDTEVSFSPGEPVLGLIVSTTQAAGTLTVRFTDDDLARLSVVEGSASRFEVGQRRVRIASTASSTASYLMLVPRTVTEVAVQVGEEPLLPVMRDDWGHLTAEIRLDQGTFVNPTADPSR